MMSTATESQPADHAIDPITLEVIRHSLVSITDQIDANITRTAFSPYVYEYKDFAVGLVSAKGELIAQSTGGMPVFVTDSVGMAVQDGLATYGRARLHHGDVIVCNHAAIQGQHLNNTVMYTPIFAGAQREGQITILKKSGEKKIIHKSKGYPLEPGDALLVETGGGGGYGSPSERPRELIERDLQRGYISRELAAREYGVTPDNDEGGRMKAKGRESGRERDA